MPDPQSGPPPPPGTPYVPPSRRPRQNQDEPDPELQPRAMRTVRGFWLALLLAVGLALLSTPWPVPVAALIASAAAVGLGVVSLVRVRAAHVRGMVPATVIAGLVLAVFMTMTTTGQVWLWREYSAYAECMDSAITQQARDACQQQLDRMLQERMDQVQQMMS